MQYQTLRMKKLINNNFSIFISSKNAYNINIPTILNEN